MADEKQTIKVGDTIPSADVYVDNPGDKRELTDLIKGKKKVIIFGVPGAYTPGCHKSHLPGYVQDYDKFVAKGVDAIICIATNDPFVMQAWGSSLKADNKVTMVSDLHLNFGKATGLVFTGSEKVMGHTRLVRFSMVVKDGVVSAINVEPDKSGLSCSLSNKILSQL